MTDVSSTPELNSSSEVNCENTRGCPRVKRHDHKREDTSPWESNLEANVCIRLERATGNTQHSGGNTWMPTLELLMDAQRGDTHSERAHSCQRLDSARTHSEETHTVREHTAVNAWIPQGRTAGRHTQGESKDVDAGASLGAPTQLRRSRPVPPGLSKEMVQVPPPLPPARHNQRPRTHRKRGTKNQFECTTETEMTHQVRRTGCRVRQQVETSCVP